MRNESSRVGRGLDIEFTDKPLSGWGGLEVLFRFWDSLGVRDVLRQALPDGRTSNNQIDVVDMTLQLLTSILTGGSRFEHVERIRNDEVIRNIVRAKRFGSASPLTSYFGSFTAAQSEHLQQVLSRVSLDLLCFDERGSDVLDLDSTVMTRHGDQEGSSKGYNPQRRGARSHRPLLGMLAKSKTICHAWLRDGSTNDRRGSCEFLVELLALLPEGFRIEAIRADAGFHSNEFLTLLEQRGLAYAIRMQMSKGLARWCAGRARWERIGPNTEIAEGMYTSSKTKITRRVIVTREVVRVERAGLFPIVDYTYAAVVTTRTEPALEVWRFYNGRGDCENRIKELKYDYNAAGFCLQNFHGTEAVLRLICFTYNLMSVFKARVLRDMRMTLGTIRTRVFVIGAALGSSGRRLILRLGLTGRWRTEFLALLARIRAVTPSTTAQLNNIIDLSRFAAPSPWRNRRQSPFKMQFN
jgi:hypothetical protein